MPALLAAWFVLGACIFTIGAGDRGHGQRSLAVVVRVPQRGDVDAHLATSSLQLRSTRCSPLTPHEKIDLVLYYVGENGDDQHVSGVADSVADSPAGRCFSRVRTVHDEAVTGVASQGVVNRRAGSPVTPHKMIVGEGVHSDLLRYDALAVVEWDLLVAATDLFYSSGELQRAAFHTNEKVLGASNLTERLALYFNSTDPASAVEFAEIACGGGGEPRDGGESGATVRSLIASSATPTLSSELPQDLVDAAEACADFATGHPGLPWTLDDCTEVWESFALTVPSWIQAEMRRSKYLALPEQGAWREIATELREVGSPCLVASTPTVDGVGSSAIRHLAVWIYSEQMGCDWVTPDFGHQPTEQGDGTLEYCHKIATREEQRNKSEEERRSTYRCAIVNWLSYFQFDVPSVARPRNETLKLVEVEPGVRGSDPIFEIQDELLTTGILDREWERVLIFFRSSYASCTLMYLNSWDEPKRQLVRRILGEARDNFHRHPRKWYDEHPKCAFAEGNLNFAVHVRMGDRRSYQGADNQYFELLGRFMDTVSTEVVARGLQEPVFHVFSETVAPCPSDETGQFDEFPIWPVAVDKAVECWAALTPDDCPKKQAGGTACDPARDGIFNVIGKNIVLHVGADVQNDLSCMIQADGLLMGCSTFGQVAGILTRGISMFSMNCGGERTPPQYKIIPPLAVAERGHLWVPIHGSWRDPVLTSVSLFRRALNTLLSERDISM